MDFVYVDDVARANVLALSSEVSDEVFNVASGVETSLNDLAAALAHAMDVHDRRRVRARARTVNAVPRRLASIDKAERLLGFRASVTLDEGLRRLVAWWRCGASARNDDHRVDDSGRAAVDGRARSRGGAARDSVRMGHAGAGGRRLRTGVRCSGRRPTCVRRVELHHRLAPGARRLRRRRRATRS